MRKRKTGELHLRRLHLRDGKRSVCSGIFLVFLAFVPGFQLTVSGYLFIRYQYQIF